MPESKEVLEKEKKDGYRMDAFRRTPDQPEIASNDESSKNLINKINCDSIAL